MAICAYINQNKRYLNFDLTPNTPLDFADIEKRTEAEIDNLLKMALFQKVFHFGSNLQNGC